MWFLLDISPSVDFGSMDKKKRSVLTEFVAVLSRLMTRRGNRVGAILYSDGVEEVIPPRSGRNQVLYLMNRLLNGSKKTTSAPTDLSDFLDTALHIIKRRSLVFVISDFISAPGWSKPLRYLVRRHEVVGIRLYDPLEVELPDIGLFLMQDAETGEQIFVDTNDKGFRRRFMEVAEKREMELRKSLQEAGVDTLELSTEDDLVDAIMRFTDLRKHRIQMAARGGLPSHMES